MLSSMTPELQRQFENFSPYDMLYELKSMFEKQARVERFNIIQTFHACKQEEGKSVSSYVLKIKSYVEKLERLVYAPKPINPKLAAKEHPTKDDACYYCKEVGAWRRNFHVHLAELMKKKKQAGTAVSKNDVLYFNVIPCDDIYEIDMLNLVLNVNSIYNVRNTTAKLNLDSTYLWQCRLAHISKKHMCQDKVFKNEVEIQLEKNIKAFRLDRGGEYISQDFKDYLKACGIFQQLTPPYIAQHNGVSKRRNHTLLDMVRSMINLKTLALSFWDYALESATRILNMVPTKKVDKTPCELWYGKVPNLSYLKETMGYYFYLPPENKIVVARYAEFLEKNLISQEASGRVVELEEIEDEDASPSKNTSENLFEVESFEPPQKDMAPVQISWKVFRHKDLQKAAFVLGSKIYQDRYKRLIGLSQSAYMDKILKTFRMYNSKRANIPMQERLDLNKTQRASTPEEDMFLVYDGNPEAELRVTCYCDAGFETDRDDIKSQTGYVFVLNGGAVDWKSSKQSTNAMSATEAEYIAPSKSAMKVVLIRKLISRLGIIPIINKPIKMLCDNSTALLIANEPGVQKGVRHYHRRYHNVRECIELGEINLLKVHTDNNLADPFTKALPKGNLTQHARSIGYRLASSFI
ncbi:retrotransposon protein, putative, ty1-copia subclass [Tanacetum coccineum]